MFQILMLTDADGPSASVLPALDLLNHKVSVAPTRTVSGTSDREWVGSSVKAWTWSWT